MPQNTTYFLKHFCDKLSKMENGEILEFDGNSYCFFRPRFQLVKGENNYSIQNIPCERIGAKFYIKLDSVDQLYTQLNTQLNSRLEDVIQ